MKLFVQLQDEVADPKQILSGTMLKAKLLASRLKSRKFKKWVKYELDGYTERKQLPDYRFIRGKVIGTYFGGRGLVSDVHLDITGLHKFIDKKIVDDLDQLALSHNIGESEAISNTDEKLGQKFPPHLVRGVARLVHPQFSGATLMEMGVTIHKPQIEGVLHAIRSRLLEFLVELGEQYPDLLESSIADPDIDPELIDRYTDKIIYIKQETVMSKQEINVDGDFSVGGHFVVADRIRNSFNGQQSTDPVVASTLKELSSALAEVVKGMESDKATELAEHFETFSREASKEKPNKPIIKAVGDAMLGVLKFAGPVAGPSLTLLNSLLKHYGF